MVLFLRENISAKRNKTISQKKYYAFGATMKRKKNICRNRRRARREIEEKRQRKRQNQRKSEETKRRNRKGRCRKIAEEG
jgi:hypothetical protein